MRRLLLLGMLAYSMLGCSGDDSDEESTIPGAPLDCAWLASNNCWKTLVASAASCVPPASEQGTLSADGSACTYGSGYDILFDEPVELPLEDFPTWNFVQRKNGAACVTYDDKVESSIYLDVQGMAFKEVAIGIGMQVTCPDGSQFAAQNAFELFECENFWGTAPGSAHSASSAAVNFALLTGMGSSLCVFDCSR
jgi:hypothetical protein